MCQSGMVNYFLTLSHKSMRLIFLKSLPKMQLIDVYYTSELSKKFRTHIGHQLSLTAATARARAKPTAATKCKTCYVVPEVGGTRNTTQNDGKRLLYMLVGPKVMIIGVNRTVLIDM